MFKGLEGKFKCLMEQYVLLERLREDLIRLKVEHESAMERRQYFLEAGNMEMARLASNTAKALLREIRKTEREIKRLKSIFVT